LLECPPLYAARREFPLCEALLRELLWEAPLRELLLDVRRGLPLLCDALLRELLCEALRGLALWDRPLRELLLDARRGLPLLWEALLRDPPLWEEPARDDPPLCDPRPPRGLRSTAETEEAVEAIATRCGVRVGRLELAGAGALRFDQLVVVGAD
jgi:hypothetical protein